MLAEEEKLKQLKIYFLFMYADGKSSPSETKYLEEILAKADLSETTRRKFEDFCRVKVPEFSNGDLEFIIEEIDKALLGEDQVNLNDSRQSMLDGVEKNEEYSNQMAKCIRMMKESAFKMPSLLYGMLWSSPYEYLDDDKAAQAQTIWTLINLGYADSDYSEAEKKIVKYLTEKWEVDPVLVAELDDTADALLALSRQKEWIQTTSKSRSDKNKFIEELDRSIAAMYANVEVSISEANIE